MSTGDVYKRVKVGDPLSIPAKVYNSLLGLLDRRGHGAVTGEIAAEFDAAIVLIKNSSGGRVGRFGVLGFNGTVIDPTADNLIGFQERVILIGQTPSLPNDAGRWAILLEPLAANEIGYAVINGACPVQVDIQSSTDKFAEAVDSDNTKLKSGGSGVPILYKESGTGVKWAVVRVGNNGGGIDVYQAGVLVQSKAPLLNMSTSRATANVMEYFPETIGGVLGIGNRFKAATSDYMVLQQVSGNALFDWVRAH